MPNKDLRQVTVAEYMKMQKKRGRVLTATQAYIELCAISVKLDGEAKHAK